MSDIDKNSPMPIYYQLKEMIKKRIERGEYKPGDRLPTEIELCSQFDISRTPVRQALNELNYEGIVFRRPGLGTFISDFTLPPSEDVMRLKVIVPEERWTTTLQKAVELWNEANPGRQVKLNLLLVGHPEFRFKIASAVGAGSAPDFSLIDSVWMAQFARDHFLLPIDEIDDSWAAEYRNDFFPALAEGSCIDGHLYSIYAQVDLALLWYRRDWFAAEKIEPPATWDDLVWVAQYFQRDEIRRRYGLGQHALALPAGLKAGETTTYLLLALLWSTGADVFQADRICLNNGGETRRTVEFIHDLVHRFKVAPEEIPRYEWNTAPKLFARGEVAMSFGGSYESAFMKDVAGWSDEEFRKRVGFVPIPAGVGGKQTTIAGGMGYGIFRQAKLPEVALEILKIATGPKLMKEFCLSTDQNPTRISVFEELQPGQDERQWFLSETSKMLYQARMRPVIPEYAMVSQQLQAMLENAVSRRMTVDEAVEKAADIISAVTGLPQA
jgi:ABC-type glycerol-3-phosphate transport system substrate-binding protein